MHKVLIYTPTYGDGPRRETIESIKAQRIEGGRVRRVVSWHNPYGDSDLRNVTPQMERARAMAMRGHYDGLLVVEHDMRLPPDALRKLWDTSVNTAAPVVYGVYLFRHGKPVLNACESYGLGSRNMGESLSLRPRALARARARKIENVSGLGLGCTLIRRDVLDVVPFRDGYRPGCTDMAFAEDCLRAGIRQVADLRVQCGHWNGERWLMPFQDEREEQIGVEALQDVTVRGGAYGRRLEAGNAYALPATEARELARAGYVRLMEGSA